jgi:hypothetical protein
MCNSSLLNCVYCSSYNVCENCANQYYLSTNNTCVLCYSTGCQQCNATGCISCIYGFYMLNSTCIACPSYCSSCSSSSNCTSLNYLYQQALVLVTINSTTYLAVCQQGCFTCSGSNPQYCVDCFPGSFLLNGICQSCNSSCLTCNSTNPNQCYTCF